MKYFKILMLHIEHYKKHRFNEYRYFKQSSLVYAMQHSQIKCQAYRIDIQVTLFLLFKSLFGIIVSILFWACSHKIVDKKITLDLFLKLLELK